MDVSVSEAGRSQGEGWVLVGRWGCQRRKVACPEGQETEEGLVDHS